jgi:transposase-like protein
MSSEPDTGPSVSAPSAIADPLAERGHTLDSRTFAASAGSFLPEDVARMLLEQLRWPDGPVCPHCRSTGAYRLHPRAASARPVRGGVLKCRACRRQFTVTVGTALAGSHVALNKWLLAIAHLCRDASGGKLDRLLNVSPQTARFLGSRVRRVLTESGSRTSATGVSASSELPLGARKSLEPSRSKGFFSSRPPLSRPSGKTGKSTKPRRRSGTENRASLEGVSFAEALATMMDPNAARTTHHTTANPSPAQAAVRSKERPDAVRVTDGTTGDRDMTFSRLSRTRCPRPSRNGFTLRNGRTTRAGRRLAGLSPV